jgi:hypothetical protein
MPIGNIRLIVASPFQSPGRDRAPRHGSEIDAGPRPSDR